MSVSDLRNYHDVLNACRETTPVYLTKKGHGKYVLMDMKDYEKMKASLKLMSQIEEGEMSASEEGWILMDDIESAFGL